MRIVVLNDGETYSAVQGCLVVEIEDDLVNQPEDVEEALRNLDFEIVMDLGKDLDSEQGYGTVTWRPEDITSRTNLTREQAEEWLESNAKYIRDRLIEIGNDSCIPTLLEEDGIELKDD